MAETGLTSYVKVHRDNPGYNHSQSRHGNSDNFKTFIMSYEQIVQGVSKNRKLLKLL